jgi:imidazole glycerol phosphate synthase subunit HisF
LSYGADRVMLNSAVIKDINFLKQSAYRFGSANLAANIEYSIIDDKPIIFFEYGRQKTTLNFSIG